MMALSVRQPWAWALTMPETSCAPKPMRWENRPLWVNSPLLIERARSLVGQEILIYAAKKCARGEYVEASVWMGKRGLALPHEATSADWVDMQQRGVLRPGLPEVPPFKDLPRGVIVARTRLVGVAHTLPHGCRIPLFGGMFLPCLLCGEINLPCDECPKADPWAIRPERGQAHQQPAIGIVLADVEPLPEPVPCVGLPGFFGVPQDMIARLP